ncbi:uncharacterized protein LOC135477516 [Liolophura sinensis]|uniref:uncharacterized protein LOC135477516 n=1 Tax=Liolophura sinensis TaxID=3198878 RepID=UPI0031586956
MAVLRMLYRRRRVLLMLVFMSLFWVVFLYLSMPASSGYEKKKGERDKVLQSKKSPLKEATQFQQEHIHESENRNQIEKVIRATQKIHQPAAPLQAPNMHIDSPIHHDVHVNISSRTSSNHSSGVTTKSTKNVGQVDKMIEFGAQIKNKTFEVGAQVKNKTLQKLSDLGLIAKPKPVIKQIGKTSILNITMSKEEIMFVIKTLIMEAEKKSSDKITHAKVSPGGHNHTNSSAGASGNLCHCMNADCTCCAQLQFIKLHVVRKACANFSFMPKSQEMSFMFLLDGKTQFTEVISAEHPPKICLGSMSKDVEICVDFFNMAFTVNMHEEHKTQLSGCLDFCFNIYNRTISTFPLGCFQIPSDSHKEDHPQIPLLGNWVP